ncbi:MAG TPA: GIY-YIG nuclease family protein [Tepidisphaeraceae bacterium]|nr:GIY-YIG nuclease family protein [Tepidisphaeraceae bacterium]
MTAESTCTYFIQAIWGGNIKIGKATDAGKRLRDLQCRSPFPLRLLGTLAPAREGRPA